MKKLLLTVAVLMSPVVIEANRYRYGSCRTSSCRTACPTTCTTSCPVTCAPVEPCPPKCYKTIMVPQTIQVPKQIEVPARKIVMPQPDMIERIPQPPIEVRTPQPPVPQPDLISYRCVPDKIVNHKQPDIIRYECPVDCNPCNECC